MYFNVGLFLKAERLALFGRPFRLRRWLYVVGFTLLFAYMWVVVAFGRALDHIFFPGFKRLAIKQPVFIIAPPRSGTTFLQNLMSLDEERFVHAKLFQTIFPSIFYQKLIAGLVRLDEICGAPLARLVAWAEKKWFGGWDDMHKLRFNQPEEDDGFFVYTFVTEAIYLLFPFVDELWEAGFADALPPAERRKLMRYYRSCLQRQLYVNGPEKTILSKATQSSGAVQCLMDEFPDANFVTIVRHPYASVASHVSVFHPVWAAHSPEIARDSAVSQSYGRLAVEWFRHLYDMRGSIDPAHYYCVDYRDLVRDPEETIGSLYSHFEYEIGPAYRASLRGAARQSGEFKSVHHYTLEEFGISKVWIQQELGELLDAYGLER